MFERRQISRASRPRLGFSASDGGIGRALVQPRDQLVQLLIVRVGLRHGTRDGERALLQLERARLVAATAADSCFRGESFHVAENDVSIPEQAHGGRWIDHCNDITTTCQQFTAGAQNKLERDAIVGPLRDAVGILEEMFLQIRPYTFAESGATNTQDCSIAVTNHSGRRPALPNKIRQLRRDAACVAAASSVAISSRRS